MMDIRIVEVLVKRYIIGLDLRHEETLQSVRSRQRRGRQRRSRIVDKQIVFFCLSCRWGSRWGIRLQPNRFSQGAQERTEQPNRASWGTQERQKQPKSAKSEPKAPQDRSKSGQERPKSSPERPKSVQERPKSVPRSPRNAPRTPNRGSQGAQERTEHPNRSNQGDLDETLPLRSEINENTAHAQQNRRPGVPRAARSSLPERPGTTRSAKSSQPGHPEQPDRASRGPIEPARTRQVVRLLAQDERDPKLVDLVGQFRYRYISL